ncbi:hypothetical protein G7046_g6173 [Stylonectria norvegica]|nr:hypothetical protein G7046_g6173 [Stylonectria norvegica]
MLLKNFLFAPLFGAALAFALPQPASDASYEKPTQIAVPSEFRLMALHSDSNMHFPKFNAALNSIFFLLPKQNASCDVGKTDGTATFYLKDGGLFLYSTSATPQQVYADRSGMGQGKLGYITGAQPPPRNGELTGWALDKENNLNLKGAEFIACPNSIDGAWSVWVSAGVDQPGGNKGCLKLPARAVEVKKPVGCSYTQYS